MLCNGRLESEARELVETCRLVQVFAESRGNRVQISQSLLKSPGILPLYKGIDRNEDIDRNYVHFKDYERHLNLKKG